MVSVGAVSCASRGPIGPAAPEALPHRSRTNPILAAPERTRASLCSYKPKACGMFCAGIAPSRQPVRANGSGDEGLDHERRDAGEDEPDHPFQDRQVRFDLGEAAVVVGQRLGRGARLLVGGTRLLQGIVKFDDDRAHRVAPTLEATARHIAPSRANVCVRRVDAE
jgi:hypothetical protein